MTERKKWLVDLNEEEKAALLTDLAERKAMARAKAREARQARAEAYRSCGMVRVRENLGGTYWE
jgi:hypothetical protein